MHFKESCTKNKLLKEKKVSKNDIRKCVISHFTSSIRNLKSLA